MGKFPDIEEILEREMKSNDRYGGGGGSSRKNPKIKPAAVMGMKGGMGK